MHYITNISTHQLSESTSAVLPWHENLPPRLFVVRRREHESLVMKGEARQKDLPTILTNHSSIIATSVIMIFAVYVFKINESGEDI